MNEQNKPQAEKKEGFALFLLKRIVIAAFFIAIVIWVVVTGINYLEKPGPWQNRMVEGHKKGQEAEGVESTTSLFEPSANASSKSHTMGNSDVSAQDSAQSRHGQTTKSKKPTMTTNHSKSAERTTIQNHQGSAALPHQQPALDRSPKTVHQTPHVVNGDKKGHGAHTGQPQDTVTPTALGVTFVDAIIAPIDYELNHRFWGWRPNDIINVTDNVNNFQLGTLEVTRRSVVLLAERISRTGSTDAFNHNLENAMNWLMVKADSYWFPSPEKKYKESLKELKMYRNNLIIGEASFYKRADNLIPLLTSFEDLLGSCDENLVKEKEKDGSKVGFFKADKYFYYAKGVANAMAVILKAIHHDFETTVNNRNGAELLHHAILSCELAASLEPLIITNAKLDGILANHRAHMAAPISHARYYIGQLVKTLST